MKKIKYPEVIGGYFTTAEFFAMEHTAFIEYCGGLLAVALFKGEFNRTLTNVIDMATARGMKRQIELDQCTK